MSEQEDKTGAVVKDNRRKDLWIKAGFVVVALVVAILIWRRHGRDPKLEGWGTDLDAALQEAKEKQTKIVVFFTRQPMGFEDKKVVENCFHRWRAKKALDYLGYLKVHLTTKANAPLIKQFDITETPALLLLDSNGEVVKKHEGFINDLKFSSDFLGVSGKEMAERDRQPNGLRCGTAPSRTAEIPGPPLRC